MAQALREFVEKDEKEAISALVKWQLNQAQEHLKKRRNIREDNIEGEVLKHTEEVRQKEEENEDNDTEDMRKVHVDSILSVNLKNVNTGQKFCVLLRGKTNQLCYVQTICLFYSIYHLIGCGIMDIIKRTPMTRLNIQLFVSF